MIDDRETGWNMDLLVSDATVVDGAGSPARPADVAVARERIVAVPARRRPRDADRLVVRSTGVEYTSINGAATRVADEDIPGISPGRLLRADA